MFMRNGTGYLGYGDNLFELSLLLTSSDGLLYRLLVGFL